MKPIKAGESFEADVEEKENCSLMLCADPEKSVKGLPYDGFAPLSRNYVHPIVSNGKFLFISCGRTLRSRRPKKSNKEPKAINLLLNK